MLRAGRLPQRAPLCGGRRQQPVRLPPPRSSSNGAPRAVRPSQPCSGRRTGSGRAASGAAQASARPGRRTRATSGARPVSPSTWPAPRTSSAGSSRCGPARGLRGECAVSPLLPPGGRPPCVLRGTGDGAPAVAKPGQALRGHGQQPRVEGDAVRPSVRRRARARASERTARDEPASFARRGGGGGRCRGACGAAGGRPRGTRARSRC